MQIPGILEHFSQTCHFHVPPRLLFTEYSSLSLLVYFTKFHVQRKLHFTTKNGKPAVPAVKGCSHNKESEDGSKPRVLNPSQTGVRGAMALNLEPGHSGLRRVISESQGSVTDREAPSRGSLDLTRRLEANGKGKDYFTLWSAIKAADPVPSKSTQGFQNHHALGEPQTDVGVHRSSGCEVACQWHTAREQRSSVCGWPLTPKPSCFRCPQALEMLREERRGLGLLRNSVSELGQCRLIPGVGRSGALVVWPWPPPPVGRLTSLVAAGLDQGFSTLALMVFEARSCVVGRLPCAL